MQDRFWVMILSGIGGRRVATGGFSRVKVARLEMFGREGLKLLRCCFETASGLLKVGGVGLVTDEVDGDVQAHAAGVV